MTDHLRVTTYDGKYTVVQNKRGEIRLLRYNEEWPAGKADNVHLVLAFDVQAARERIKDLFTALRKGP